MKYSFNVIPGSSLASRTFFLILLDKSRTINFYTDEDGTTGITEEQVCKSAAGYYIGRMCDEGPYSRVSPYYETKKVAQQALILNEYY